MKRESFGSRLGFILVSAGCAIGLGNIWRFPYITGEYGGGAFVVIYLLFLLILTLPILIMEFAIGRGSQKCAAKAYDVLEPKGSKWHLLKWVSLGGSYLLLMFYCTVTGWMLISFGYSVTGKFDGISLEGAAQVFSTSISDPALMIGITVFVVLLAVLAVFKGVMGGLEKVTKVLMALLLVLLIAMVIHSFTLPGLGEGLAFYLMPDFGKLFANGFSTFSSAIFAAMGQAFFTLSVGIGSMLVFGSYIGKNRTLGGEAVRIAALDTLVALMAGFIIFPACFTYGVEAGSGPSLVFITLPVVFSQMAGGTIWSSIFFLLMSAAALSTVFAVFENMVCFSMDEWGMSRNGATAINGIALAVLCMPCALCFGVLSGITIPGIGDIQAIEDFLVSSNALPLGSLAMLLFCTRKKGWGFDAFLAEVNTGEGLKIPRWIKGYVSFVLPVLILAVWISGYIPIVSSWLGIG